MTSALQVVIATATVADTEALTTIVRTSSAYAGHYRVQVVNRTIDADYIGRNLTRVAHGLSGEVLGFGSLQVPGRGGPGEGEFDFLFVANEAQGQGIGLMLFEDIRTQAVRLGLRRIHFVPHPPSAEFHRRRGARDVGVVPPGGWVDWCRPHLVLDLE